jgi:hypothetical protein
VIVLAAVLVAAPAVFAAEIKVMGINTVKEIL